MPETWRDTGHKGLMPGVKGAALEDRVAVIDGPGLVFTRNQ